jgi:mannose-6-phosphate isomerase-like protein (cupin superfamily)
MIVGEGPCIGGAQWPGVNAIALLFGSGKKFARFWSRRPTMGLVYSIQSPAGFSMPTVLKEETSMSFNLSKLVLQPDEGEVLVVGPPATGQIIIKIDPNNTGETRLAMGVEVIEPEGFIPVHLHEGLEELFFFYAGQGKAVIEDHEVELIPGTTLYVPRQVWHGITNTGVEPLRFTWTVCPPGLENFFRELGQPVVKGELGGAPPPGPPDLDALVKIAERHGMRMKVR